MQCHDVVAEAARRILRTVGAVDLYGFEQLVRRRVAELVLVLEYDQAARRHLAARGRAVVLEHAAEGLPEQLQIVLREAGALGQVRRYEPVRAVEAAGYDVLAAHRARSS